MPEITTIQVAYLRMPLFALTTAIPRLAVRLAQTFARHDPCVSGVILFRCGRSRKEGSRPY